MSNITRFQFQEMQTRLARPARKAEPPPEKTVHRVIMEHCDNQWPRWKYVHSQFGVATRNDAGVPDFVIAVPGGRTIYVEVKRPGNKLSPAQLAWKLELEKLGHRLCVVYDYEDFLEQVGPYLSHPLTKTKTTKT